MRPRKESGGRNGGAGAGGDDGREPFAGDFDGLIAEILAGLGSTDWDGVERRWNLIRLAVLRAHWAANGPPVHRSVASYLGIVEPPAGPSEPMDGDDFESFMRAVAPDGWG